MTKRIRAANVEVMLVLNFFEELKAKVAGFEKTERVTKLAQEMEDKGLNGELSLEEKCAHLEKVANLDVTEEAIKMASPQGQLLGGPSDVPGVGEDSLSALVTYINDGVDIRE